jgi:hypothetical protein
MRVVGNEMMEIKLYKVMTTDLRTLCPLFPLLLKCLCTGLVSPRAIHNIQGRMACSCGRDRKIALSSIIYQHKARDRSKNACCPQGFFNPSLVSS